MSEPFTVAVNLTSPSHEQKALIYGPSAIMHLLHSTRCPSRRLRKEFQQPQFTENGVKVSGNAGNLDFQTLTFHLQTPQSDGLQLPQQIMHFDALAF